MHNVDTLVCQIGRNIGELWKLQGKMSYSEGVHQTARSPKRLIDTGLNLSGLFLYDGATLRCSYNVCLYAGQSQRDVKFENS